MKKMWRVLMLLLLCASAHAGEPPAPLREVSPSWSEVGSGKMRWFGLLIYDIALWSSAPRFDPAAPYALSIRYARNIPGDKLVETSLDQMRGQGVRDEAQLSRWGKALAGVFPDVKPGDNIIGIHLPGTGARFYHQGKLTGTLTDPALARAFFAIWMDEKTSEPDLRSQLLGRR